MKRKAPKPKSRKAPTRTSKESWVRGISDADLQKLLAARAKLNPGTALSGKPTGRTPAFIFMRPICKDFDCPNWPNPNTPPTDPCAGMTWVWQPDLAVKLFTINDCPPDADLALIKQALRGKLSSFGFSDPDVRVACQNSVISISIWGTSVQPGSCDDQARNRSHIPDDIAQDRLFGIYVNATLIRRLAQQAFNNMPKTLDASGNPNDNGPIHLTSLSVGFTPPSTVETYIGGYDERPWPDVSFTTTITDQLGDVDHPDSSQKTCQSSTDTQASKFDEFLAFLLGSISVAFTVALPILFPLTSFALLTDIFALLIQPDNAPAGGVGCRVLELLPDQIPLPQTGGIRPPVPPVVSAGNIAARIGTALPRPKKQKLVINYDKRPTVDDRGLFVSGTPSLQDRTPMVHIVGPSSLSISTNAQQTFGFFTAEPDDFYGNLTFAWTGGPSVQSPSSQKTKITFARGTAKPGTTFQRTVNVRVIDQEGSTSTATFTVSINVNESGDLPPLCQIKPWLPQCQPGGD